MVAGLVMRLVVGLVFDDEGGSDLGGVLSFALVLNVGVESVVVVSCVGHLLDSAVWEMDGVAPDHVLSIAFLGLLEVGTVVRVLNPIGEAVGLGGGFVPLVVATTVPTMVVVVATMPVWVYGRGMGGDGTEKEGQETEGTHCGCCYTEDLCLSCWVVERRN